MAGGMVQRALLAWAAFLGGRATVVVGADSRAVAGVGKVLRIACVGDSLTEGYHASNGKSYPSLLQKLLGPGYFVMNFGHSGSTLTGPQQAYPQKIVYSHTSEYTNSLQSEPDIVILMIGSNDATSMVWPTFHQDFEPAYTKLVGVYQALPSRPLVFVAVPPPLYKNAAYGMLQDIINSNFPAAMPRIAGTMRLPPPIPVFGVFKSRCPDLNSLACPYISGAAAPHSVAHDDGCHPNDQGYLLIAQTVQAAIAPLAQTLDSREPARPASQPFMGLPAAFGAVQATGAEWWAKRRRLQAEASVSEREEGQVLIV